MLTEVRSSKRRITGVVSFGWILGTTLAPPSSSPHFQWFSSATDCLATHIAQCRNLCTYTKSINHLGYLAHYFRDFWGVWEGDGIKWRDRCGPTNLILYPFPRSLDSPPGKHGPCVCPPSISLAWGLSAGPDPKGSHVFPGSPQVLSRAGAAGLGCRQPGDESCGAASGSFPRLGTGS